MAAEAVEFLVFLGIVAIMGLMGGDALYVRALYQPIDYVLIALGVAFAVSNQVSAAISRGMGREQDVLAAAVSIARVWLCGGLVVCTALAFAAPAMADLLRIEPAARAGFVGFLRWTVFAGLLTIGPALAASSLRGAGMVRRALVVTMSAALTNIGGVALLGLVFRIGIAAIPISLALSSLIGLAAGLLILRRTELWRPSAFRSWRPEVLGHLRRIGAPVAASFLLIALYNLAVLQVLRPFGPDPIAGFSVALAAQNLIFLPGTMLGAATAIMINQQRGAGESHLIRHTLRSGLEIATSLYLVVAVAVWLLGGVYADVMNSNPAIAHHTAAYLTTIGLTYVVQGPVLAALTVMEHTGGGFLAIVLNIIYFALIVVTAHVVTSFVPSATAFYNTVAWCNLIGVTVPIVAIRYIRKLSRPAPSGRIRFAEAD
ncbi:MATE family efflux transporter [Lentzea aerocolonigenes]|uniref:MATE family efflux transporter n=1 Tax=Lentzea aerocolonigenes TaxID=68170 RepID=UPI000690C9C5|nr:MATE family efflux transporter [Lentzea aerocolonigenes]